MVNLSNKDQAFLQVAGVGLAALGVFEMVRAGGDATTGGSMVAAGLALTGAKELAQGTTP